MRVRILLLSLILGLISVPAWASESSRYGGHHNYANGRSISVQGLGVVSVRPDVAVIQAGVTAQAASAKAALAEHHKVMSNLLVELDKFGLAARDVQSRQVNLRAIYPRRKNNQDAASAPSAFRAMGNLRVRLRQVDRLGDLLDQLTNAGANSISGLHFAISEPGPLQDKARELAVQDARRRALLYTGEAGVQLGEVLRIREGGAPGPVREFRTMAASGSQSSTAPGEKEIRMAVRVVFAIK